MLWAQAYYGANLAQQTIKQKQALAPQAEFHRLAKWNWFAAREVCTTF